METTSDRYKETILFRDYLRNNPTKITEYQNLKKKLATKYPNDRTAYINGKNDFIKNVIALASKK